MRFLHLSDLHLGKYVLETSMLEEQRLFLTQAIDCAKERQADGVLLAGDLYDRSVPPAEAVEVLDDFLAGLNAAGIPVFAVAGNHDSPERLQFGSRILAGRGVHIAGVYDGTIPSVPLMDSFGTLTVHLLPFVKPATVRARLDTDAATTEAAVRAALCEVARDDGQRHVLVAHQFVCAGGEQPETCDSETPAVGGSDAVDVSAFDGFDYVALGHLHRAQRMGRDTVRYAGSPLKYSLSEVGHRKSFTLVTLEEPGNVQIEQIPVTPRRDLRRIRGELDALLEAARESPDGRDDYIWAVLTGEPVLDPAERLRAVYPQLLHVEYAHTGQADTVTAAAARLEEQTDEQLFAAFFEKMNGHPMTEREYARLRVALQKEETV